MTQNSNGTKEYAVKSLPSNSEFQEATNITSFLRFDIACSLTFAQNKD